MSRTTAPRAEHLHGQGHARQSPYTRGCESCHGPGRARVEAGGGKDTIPIRFGKDSRNTVAEQNSACIDCHNRGTFLHVTASINPCRLRQNQASFPTPPTRPSPHAPNGVQTIATCNGCYTANNDWESAATDPACVYSVGVDLYFGKKIYFTTFHTVSGGKGDVNQRFLGDPTIVAPVAPARNPNAFLLTGTNAATPYLETVDHRVPFLIARASALPLVPV